jgi:translation initiation factor 3 subunit G
MLKVIVERGGKKTSSGKEIKVIKAVQRNIPDVIRRSNLTRFGEAQVRQDGITSFGEEIQFKLQIPNVGDNNNNNNNNNNSDQIISEQVKKQMTQGITCRTCKGDHWTTQCPYKDTLVVTEKTTKPESKTGVYVPPSSRGGGSGNNSESYSRNEELHTVRVTNITEDATEEDIRDLFSRFGQISRLFLAKDKDTNLCKGFAFINFTIRKNAERAIEVMNGRGYGNLILNCEWAERKD